jgi:hypothetical protein
MTIAAKNCTSRRWWLPSVSVTLWLIVFLTLNLTAWRYALINVDGDSCVHRRLGDWMIQHREIIRNDPFSHTRTGAHIIVMEWLSEVLYAAAGMLLDWSGIVLMAAALIATSLWLLHRLLLAEGNGILLSTALVLLSAWSCSLHWLARPHLWTFVFMPIFLWQLRAYNCRRVPATRLFLVLPPLMAFWSNLHGGFVQGFVLIAAFWMGSVIDETGVDGALRTQARSRTRMLILLGGTCLLASFINPNGWKLHVHILNCLRDTQIMATSSEFRSPDFHGFWMYGFIVELLVFGLLLIIARPRLTAIDVALVCLWGYFSLYSVRHATTLALILTPILAAHWSAWIRGVPDGTFIRWGRQLSRTLGRWDAIADGRALAAGCVIVVLFTAAKSRLLGGEPILKADMLSSVFPVSAVKFLRANPVPVTGEMFNHYRWGGYLLLVAPEWKVFVDGRADLYHGSLIEDFRTVDSVAPQWEQVFARHDVGWTLLPRAHALNSLLALHTDWRLIYSDEVAIIYGRIAGPL